MAITVREAALDAIRRYGVGTGSVRTIAGTMDIHMALERELAAARGETEAALARVHELEQLRAGDEQVLLVEELAGDLGRALGPGEQFPGQRRGLGLCGPVRPAVTHGGRALEPARNGLSSASGGGRFQL